MLDAHTTARRRAGAALLAALGAALLAGCTSPAPALDAPAPSGTSYSIPSSTNRAPDPPLPTDYDQDTNNELTAEEASLPQLWALANSEVDPSATEAPEQGFADFSAAITARCYPILDPAEAAELEQLHATYLPLTGPDAVTAARAYFDRATALCM